MMDIEYLKYKDEVNDLLIKSFPEITERSLSYYITPATFETLSKSHNFDLTWNKMYSHFDSHWLNFSDEEILMKLLKPSFFDNSKVLIITDQDLRKKEIPVIDSKDLVNFICGDHYEMNFFQAQDIIIATLDFTKIFMVHHEEYFCHTER